MAHASGINGAVYSNNTLVEDCEDAWNEQVIGGCTSSTTTGKVGTNAARVTTVGIGATTVLESEVIALDLTAYDAVMFWARSSLSPSAGNLELLLDDTADCASPLENLDLPGLTAATWFMWCRTRATCRQSFRKPATPSLSRSLGWRPIRRVPAIAGAGSATTNASGCLKNARDCRTPTAR